MSQACGALTSVRSVGLHFRIRLSAKSMPMSSSIGNGAPTRQPHPVLRARYADAVWDLKRKVTTLAPDVRFARVAIDSYLECFLAGLADLPMAAPRYLKRAMSLALSIGDEGRLDKTKARILTAVESLDANYVGAWGSLFDALYEVRKSALTAEELTRLVAAMERILSENLQEGARFNAFAAQASAERLAQHYRRAGLLNEVERVVRSWCGAFEALASRSNPALAVSYLARSSTSNRRALTPQA